jgi:hypothetical protein
VIQLLICKGGIYRQIDSKKLQQYKDKGYAEVEEKTKAAPAASAAPKPVSKK